MAENKTKETEASVADFIASVENDQRRKDAETLIPLFRRLSGREPKMWGPSMIGFGSYHYKYESGREGDMLLTGFSPRKSNLAFYVGAGRADPELMKKLGKHKTGASCLYVNKLADIEMDVLEQLIAADIAYMRANYDTT